MNQDYQYQSYPAIRYHPAHGAIEVKDTDDEISKCGEACDTKHGAPNKQGWCDHPYTPQPSKDDGPRILRRKR